MANFAGSELVCNPLPLEKNYTTTAITNFSNSSEQAADPLHVTCLRPVSHRSDQRLQLKTLHSQLINTAAVALGACVCGGPGRVVGWLAMGAGPGGERVESAEHHSKRFLSLSARPGSGAGRGKAGSAALQRLCTALVAACGCGPAGLPHQGCPRPAREQHSAGQRHIQQQHLWLAQLAATAAAPHTSRATPPAVAGACRQHVLWRGLDSTNLATARARAHSALCLQVAGCKGLAEGVLFERLYSFFLNQAAGGSYRAAFLDISPSFPAPADRAPTLTAAQRCRSGGGAAQCTQAEAAH